MNQYPVERIVSSGKKGKAMIIVNFNCRSITRHVVNGMGRHPDDSIPAVHKRLEDELENNKRDTDNKREAIAILQRQPPKHLKPVEITTLLAKLAAEVRDLEAVRPIIEDALSNVRKEDPLMVRYA